MIYKRQLLYGILAILLLISPFNGSCYTSSYQQTIKVKAAPDPTLDISAEFEKICQGESTLIRIHNSENGIEYQLYNETNGVNVGNPIIGNGNPNVPINFAPITPIVTSVYKVIATDPNSSESTELTEKITISVSSPPDLNLEVTSDYTTICEGEPVTITLISNEPNVSYQLSDGNNLGNPVVGDGNDIVFPAVVPPNNTTYKVLARGQDCVTYKPLSDVVKIDWFQKPNTDIEIEAAPSPICPGETVAISLTSSETGVKYQLNNGISNIGSWVDGTGFSLTLSTDQPTTSTLYRVLVQGDQCNGKMELDNKKLVQVNTPPDNSIELTATPETLCPGEGTNLQLASSESGISYQLYGNNTPLGNPVSGDGTPINFPQEFPSTPTNYSVKAKSPDCSAETELSSTVQVTLLNLPLKDLTVSGTPATICQGENANITIDNTEADVSYQLSTGSTPIGTALTGNGGTLTFQVSPGVTTTYQIQATREGCSTSIFLDGEVSISVSAPPTLDLNLTVIPNEICEGEQATVSLENTENGIDYQLSDGTNSIGAPMTGNGGTINFPEVAPTATTTYSVAAQGIGCSTTYDMEKTATLTVNTKPNPDLPVQASPQTICQGEDVNITVDNSQDGYTYELVDENSNTVSSQTGTGSQITFSLKPSTTQTYSVRVTGAGCSEITTLTQTVSVTVNPGPKLDLIVGADNSRICESKNQAVLITVENTESGMNYTLNNGTADIETIAGDDSNKTFASVSPSATTLYRVITSAPGCTGQLELEQKVLLTVVPLPDDQIPLDITHETICLGEKTQISMQSSETGVSYQLFDGTKNEGAPIDGTGNNIEFPEFAPFRSLIYQVIATNQECQTSLPLQQELEVTVSLPPEEHLHPAIDKSRICEGEEIVISLAPSDPDANYQLLEGNTPIGNAIPGNGEEMDFPPFSPSQSTTYTIEAHGKNCLNPVEIPYPVQVEVHHPPLTNQDMEADNYRICPGEEASISLNNSQDGIFYQLFAEDQSQGAPVVGNNDTIQFAHLHPSQTTTYSIKAHEEVCSDPITLTETLVVEVIDPASATVQPTATPADFCEGESTQIAIPQTQQDWIYILAQDLNPIGSPITGNGGPIEFSTLTPEESTTYQILLGSCVTHRPISTIDVTVHPNPEVEVVTNPVTERYDGSLTIAVKEGAAPFQYIISPGDTILTHQSLLEQNNLRAGEYLIKVTDANGCVSSAEGTTAEISIDENPKVVVNNTLTPNGDGINDEWIIQYDPDLGTPEVFIFNIYGQEIYHTNSYQNEWKGTYNGSTLPDGAYYYLIKFKDAGIKPVKGTISILGNH